MRTFTVERRYDESGISGTGVVMEGVEFSDRQVVIKWMTDPGSMVTWNHYADFKRVCIDGHPTNDTVVRWSDGEVWWQAGPPDVAGSHEANGYEVTVESPLSTKSPVGVASREIRRQLEQGRAV